MIMSSFSRALAIGNRRLPPRLRHWRLQLLAVRYSRHLQGHLRERPLLTDEGFTMLVDGESQVGRILYSTGHYEEGIVRVLKRRLKAGDVFVDGGAHIGFFSVLASRLVGAEGRVVAFEPAAGTRRTLEANVARNGCSNVVVRSEALGRTAARAGLVHTQSGQTGQATLRSTNDAVSTEQVQVVPLDSLAATVGRVRLAKLDLEGFELEALVGMTNILDQHHPDLVVEVTDTFLRQSGNGSALMLYRFLSERGYRAHVILDDGLKSVASEDEWMQFIPTQFNALFTTSR